MKRPTFAARLVVLAMTLVTAWSLWAWAGQNGPERARLEQGAPHAQAGERGEAESSDEAGPAPINWFEFGGKTPPFIAMLINFGLLAGGYYLLGRKPVAAGLQNRRNAIARDIEDAQRMKQEAELRAKTYQAKLERLEQDVRSAREALLHAGVAERERLVKEAEAKAERMRKDAAFLVEQEIKQVRQDLWREAVEAAVAAAQELLSTRVTQADQERLAEDHLAELGGPAKPAPVTTSQETTS